MSEIREPLITTTISNLTPATFASSVGRVYLSKPMIANQEDAVRIIDTWKSVHVPTAGAMIPNTTNIHTRTGDSGIITMFTPTANKSYALYAADVTNGGGAPLSAVFGLSNGSKFVQLGQVAIAPPAETAAFSWYAPVFFDSDHYPAFKITSGTAGDASVQIVVAEVVQ